MVRSNLDLQQAICIIDDKIHPKHLNKVQEIIFVKSLQGKTYSQIAIEHNYGMEYIKTSGSELWKMLSQAFGQQVNKNNCNSFIRRQILEFASNTFSATKQAKSTNIQEAATVVSSSKQEIDSISLIAPKIANFRGRKIELAQLEEWSRDPNCQFIMMTGMIGCGKTTLAIRAAEILKDKFHRVIYLSISNSLELKDSIQFCLHILNPDLDTSSDLNKLLVNLTLYLQKYRCLLILDDLDSIVEFKNMATHYLSGYEQYAQFLRCLITTNHQSLVIATSRNSINQLSYYSSDRVKLLALQGIRSDVLWSIFQTKIIKNISQEVWGQICAYYQNNPELINIVIENFTYLPVSDQNIYHMYVPYIKEIDMIIEKELRFLDGIAKEIVYWLAFSFNNHTLPKLFHRINYPQNEILKVIDFLKEHSLIVENECSYALQPMFKDYIQRYLIKAAKELDN